MNRKFIKENKPLVREFLGKLLTNIILGKVDKDFQKLIDKDPSIQQKKEKIKDMEKQLLDKVRDAYKNNPKFKRVMDKHNIQIN